MAEETSEAVERWRRQLDDPVWSSLFFYSEWLDGEQNLLKAPDGDERTHEELVNEFLAERREESED